MKRRILTLVCILCFFFQSCFSQQSKSPLSREFVISLTDLLCKGHINSDTLKNMQEMIWLAYSSPEIFDTKYKNELHKYFGSYIDTDKNGKEHIVQYTATGSKLVYDEDEVGYLYSLIDTFLSNYGFTGNGDDISGIEGAFFNFLLTKDIKLPPHTENDDLYSYLNKISRHLKTLNLCVLKEAKGFDLIVCSCEKSERLIAQLKLLNCEFKQQ